MRADAASPQVTVIVAVFNGAKTLSHLLDSIDSQTYRNVELILIDGGSTDGTIEIIMLRQSQISYWISEPDKGIYDAWNKGLAQAHGDWICFIGADDYFWKNDVLEKMLPFLSMSGKPSKLVYSSIAVVTQDGRLLYTVGAPWEKVGGKLRDVMLVPHPGMMHHRSWFDEYGIFDSSFRIAGDYEMLLRGWKKETAVFIPDLIAVGMVQGGISSTPANALKQLHEVRRAQKKWGVGLSGWRFIAALSRVYIRVMLQVVLGERLTYRLLDMGRWILGKDAYWTKL